MLGWLLPTPRCPVGTLVKAWTERRMLWLSEQFGRDRLLGAEILLPRPPFFPDADDRTAAARHVLDRLCGSMGIDPAAIDLEVGPGSSRTETEPAPRRGGTPSTGVQKR